MNTKTCPSCGKEYKFDFHHWVTKPDGKTIICIPCFNKLYDCGDSPVDGFVPAPDQQQGRPA
jgi:hypothetical protein